MQADKISVQWTVVPPIKHGGMGMEQLKELKRLQKENERLRRAVSDLTLDKLILKEAVSGNVCAPRVGGPALIMW